MGTRGILGCFSSTPSANARAAFQHATKAVAQLAENNKSNVLKVVIISMGNVKSRLSLDGHPFGGSELHEGAAAHELQCSEM